MLLRSFIRFAETKRSRFVTTKLALQWATQPPNAKRVQSGSRLATVRRFAEYLSTVDPRTEVPSPKLLPYHIDVYKRQLESYLRRPGNVLPTPP